MIPGKCPTHIIKLLRILQLVQVKNTCLNVYTRIIIYKCTVRFYKMF